MSLRTKIRGFTAWVNLRLQPYNQLLSNVLMDLMSGTNMKMLLQSLTGRERTRLQSFDGLSQQQKISRIEWMLEELKKSKVIPGDVFVDSRLFAMRSADHVFSFLWQLVSHDIWFVWERSEFLQHDSDEILAEVPFKWIPEPRPPPKKKKTKTRKSLLSGFGASSMIREAIEEDEDEPVEGRWVPFPHSSYMKKFKNRPATADRQTLQPPPENCIMEMVNRQLKTLQEGKKLYCHNTDDLVDSRVLCALVNSFLPNTFTTEVLLNDRWTINLILGTTEKMFYINSPFDSEDLVEAEKTSVCAYFCVFFMVAYKFRQTQAVVRRVESLKKIARESHLELERMPEGSLEAATRRRTLKAEVENTETLLTKIRSRFDMEFCYKWIDHVHEVVKQMHEEIKRKMNDRFDTISIPRTLSINDLCLYLGINLNLSKGSGFYAAEGKESLSEGRKLVLRERSSKEFIDDYTSKGKEPIKKVLRLSQRFPVDIKPDQYSKYELYFEALSRNKQLQAGSTFLYQVFPGNTLTWQKIFLKAVKDNEVQTVQRMVAFFRAFPAFINCREAQTGNSPLHWACKLGHHEIAMCLLENGANLDQKNSAKQTPLFSACEGLQKEMAFLMIEWGCDIHVKGHRNRAAFETIKNDEFREFLIDAYEHYSSVVPKVMEGDTMLLQEMVENHVAGSRPLCNLRSRCINGSTLLHTAAYFSCIPVIHELLRLGLDVNLLDYKGATALHRARDVETMQVLIEAGAKPSLEDSEGNTPLHVKCYGETGKPAEVDTIQLLLDMGAKVTSSNHRGLMPVHCCAMQGRIDVMTMLLECDQDGEIRKALESERSGAPPSLVHLALANDGIEAAFWLREHDVSFKEEEPDLLLQKILTEQIKLNNRAMSVQFLLDNGASPNPKYPGGNSALHYAASISGPTDVLEVLIAYGADLDAPNDDQASPLFFACQCNNQFAASILLGQGCNVRAKNLQGLTAFDYIMDYDEWVECGYFSDEIRARLKAYSLKHARDLIRAISKKVKATDRHWLQEVNRQNLVSQSYSQLTSSLPPTRMALRPTCTADLHGQAGRQTQSLVSFSLPPLEQHQRSHPLMY